MDRVGRSCVQRRLRVILLAGFTVGLCIFATTALASSRGREHPGPGADRSPSAERIVRFARGTSAADMTQAVEKAGGEVGTVTPEIFTVSVRNDDKSFEEKISRDPKVQALFVDRYISFGPSDERTSVSGGSTVSVPEGTTGDFPDPLHDAAAPNAEKIVQWDDNRMNVPAAWEQTKGDSSLVVAVLDTGVSGKTTELRDNYDPRKSQNQLDCKTIKREEGKGFLKEAGIQEECKDGDRDGHGTWIASRIGAAANGQGSNGVAPSVTIRSYKVLAGEWGGLTSWIVDGMVEACRDGADILNMSIVGYDDPALEEDAQDYLLWADAVDYCRSRGAAIIASAGNEHVRVDKADITVAGRRFSGAGLVPDGQEGIGTIYPGEELEPYYNDMRGMLLIPGGIPGVILVSATGNEVVEAPDALPEVSWPEEHLGARDQLAYYSNYGSRIDIAAPGGARKYNIALFDGGPGDILAGGFGSFAAVDWNTLYCQEAELSASFNSACFKIGNQAYAWSQGTSMAAPNVAGVAVLVLSAHHELQHRPDALLARLIQTARSKLSNYTGPNDPDNKAPSIDGIPCDTGFCHMDFDHPISRTDAYGAGIVDAGAAVS
jgi:subtilisin family serine protease